MMHLPWKTMLLIFMVLLVYRTNAQVQVFGKIYDERKLPLQGVSVVIEGSNTGVSTNLLGEYFIKALPGDTIKFSFLGFRDEFVAINIKLGMLKKDIILYPKNIDLQEVQVMGRRNRQKDSIEMRMEYGHIFSYKPPGVGQYALMAISSPITMLGELLNFKKRKRNKNFRNTLLYFEEQRFIESRIPMDMVRDKTGLQGDELTKFYNTYMRDYEFAKTANTYDILNRIERSLKAYENSLQADTLLNP